MRVDVMQHEGCTQPLSHAGYYETAHHRQLMIDSKSAILEGPLIALCGVIGRGKTVTLRRLQQQRKADNRVLVAKSLAVEKHRITLGTLIPALFYDLSTEKPLRIPTQSEKRERDLRDLVKKGQRPVVLFVDETHDLTRHTLTDLTRLLEVVEDGDGTLAIVLAGHPKLGNDLRRPTMEESGYRTDVFPWDGIAGSQREYLPWLFHVCTAGKLEPERLLTPEAIALLASKLRTPLQMQRHLTLALEVGYQTGEQPISAGMVDTVLSQQFDDLEPTLTRHGYHITDLVQQFDAKPTEIKALFRNQLDPTRTAVLRDRMLRAGLPL
jgi:type II secretory pathway predicted ATPase ExeA